MELRAGSDIASWLAAGLALQRVPLPADPEAATRAEASIAAALVACASELAALPPPGVIADLALLLGGARLVAEPPAVAHDGLRAALRAYDDDLLGRLATTPRFDDAIAAVAHLAPGRRAEAVALVLDSLLDRCGFTGVSVSPGALRRELSRGRVARDAASLATAAPALAAEYLRLARGARQTRQLVDDREVFAIDHLAVLGSFGRRLAARHIAAAAEALTAAVPRRLPARREHQGVTATSLAAEDTYPAGGFSSITPGGAGANLENLVTSELAYMEDDADGPVDVFTLRYVEGELLFYTRDDSVFRRHRHAITFVLAAELTDARVKDPALPWQRLVLALGVLVAATRWLIAGLGHQALAIRLVFPPAVLAAERELVALLLAGEIEAGLVTVEERAWGAALDAAAAVDAPLADLVVVSLAAAPVLPRDVRAAHLALDAATPTFRDLHAPAAAPDPDPWRAWTDATEELLRWLV